MRFSYLVIAKEIWLMNTTRNTTRKHSSFPPGKVLSLLLLILLFACGPSEASFPQGSTIRSTAVFSSNKNKQVKLILGAYTTPREVYRQLIPIFQKQWKEKTGQEVIFEESYLGSGAQSRAIIDGFEADIAALSLKEDITRIQKAGLIAPGWDKGPQKGIGSTSIVAFAVRQGNPQGIKDWADLVKPGLQILTPNPKMSGGAMWNILALYGAAKRGFVAGVQKNNDTQAQAFLCSVFNNVLVMDKGARESITNFENGVGDVVITYENEIYVGKKAGQIYEMVIPRSTILIENPVAVVDTYVDKHGTREVAEAFVNFLFTHEAQEIFARNGLRSIDPMVAKSTSAQYPSIQDLFKIDYFGGWQKATPDFFGEQGIFNICISKIHS